MLEKLHGIASGANRRVVVRQYHHSGRADEATVGLQGIEVQRDGVQRGGQNTARRAAGQVGIKGVPGLHAATVFVNQFLNGDAGSGQLDAGSIDAARDRKRTQAFAAIAPLGGEPIRPFFQYFAHPVKGFEVVL